MDLNNDTQAGQPNGHENGIKRPHQEDNHENDHEHEPDTKRVRVDPSNDAENLLVNTQTKAADESKADENASQIEPKVQDEVGDSSAVPRGTAMIKPE